jgi:hypothetical protein
LLAAIATPALARLQRGSFALFFVRTKHASLISNTLAPAVQVPGHLPDERMAIGISQCRWPQDVPKRVEVVLTADKSPPTAFNPHVTMTPPAPMTSHPYRIGMWARCPAASDPNPLITPGPVAGGPEPNTHRSGTRGNDFNLWRRWRGVHHHCASRRRSYRCRGLAFINHATCQQRQAHGN